jgi:hypothetical protein
MLPLLVVITRDAGMLLAGVRLEPPVRRKKRTRKSQGGDIRDLESEGNDGARRWSAAGEVSSLRMEVLSWVGTRMARGAAS